MVNFLDQNMKKTFTMIFFSPKCASVSLFIQNIASAENILLPLRVFEFKSLLKTVHPLPPFFQLPLYPSGECEITQRYPLS